MANKVYISFYNPILNRGVGGQDTLISPLNDEVMLDIQSEFQAVGDMIPSWASGIVSAIRTGSGLSQTASPELEKLLNIPFWTKTNPMKLNVPLLFYLKTDARKDVFEPAMGLASTSLINIKKGVWKTPGIALSDAMKLKDDSKAKTSLKDSSILISVEIPGIISLPQALVFNAKPTFSKDLVRSETDGLYYPIYAKVDLEVRSLYPANTDMLNASGNGFF